MSSIGNEEHENMLFETLNELAKNGYRVIDLKGKSPDGIAVKDNKIIAVEIMGQTYKKGIGWKKSNTITQKEDDYKMFDDVLIRTFNRSKIHKDEKFKDKKLYDRIKIYCQNCNHPMIFESMNGNISIFICELCEREVKAISIGKQ